MAKQPKNPKPSEPGASPIPPAMAAFNPVVSAAWLDIMKESARFVADRLQQDMEARKALLECRGPADVMRVQTEFCQKAFEDYMAETMRMMEMMSKATQATIEEAKTPHSRGYDDIPV